MHIVEKRGFVLERVFQHLYLDFCWARRVTDLDCFRSMFLDERCETFDAHDYDTYDGAGGGERQRDCQTGTNKAKAIYAIVHSAI